MTVTTVIQPDDTTVIIRADWPYEAWDEAHRRMRRNVKLTERVGQTFYFEPTGEPRWPTAADYYRKMAHGLHEQVRTLRHTGAEPKRIRQAMELARSYRVRLFDAKTGCVTDHDTMRNFEHQS